MISDINKKLDASLRQCFKRRLEGEYPYLILDARYERVREDGMIASRAVLVEIGISWEGRGQVLAVELANRETASSWRSFLERLRERGIRGVEFVGSDDRAGLRKAIMEILPEAVWQRCYMHFLRNALDHLPRKADDECLRELRPLHERRNAEEARRDPATWLRRRQAKYPKLCSSVDENIEETLTFYGLPQ